MRACIECTCRQRVNSARLDAMQKGDTVEHIRRGVKLLQAHGIEVGLFVMIGYPGESRQDLDQTIEMLHDLKRTSIW